MKIKGRRKIKAFLVSLGLMKQREKLNKAKKVTKQIRFKVK